MANALTRAAIIFSKALSVLAMLVPYGNSVIKWSGLVFGK